MSRRSRRVRASIPATVQAIVGSERIVCRTRDVSDAGVSLDTIARLPAGTRVTIALMDPTAGSAVELAGEVVRTTTGKAPSLGIALHDPPPEWNHLVSSLGAGQDGEKSGRRLRVLVVGDDHRQRGAMALYVTSGWDVVFAVDADSVSDALGVGPFDAVIAEVDASDPRWQPILTEARRVQPRARRIVRTQHSRGAADPEGVVHRFVDRDAGLEALRDALTADFGR